MKRLLVLPVCFGLFMLGCSSDDEQVRGSGLEGHSDAIEVDLTEEETVEGLKAVFQSAGAKPELAECYVDVYTEEGLAEDINNLSDLATVQANLTDDQKAKVDDCGSNA